jgi:hypothetical protein
MPSWILVRWLPRRRERHLQSGVGRMLQCCRAGILSIKILVRADTIVRQGLRKQTRQLVQLVPILLPQTIHNLSTAPPVQQVIIVSAQVLLPQLAPSAHTLTRRVTQLQPHA